MTKKAKVEGMKCAGCATTVAERLKPLLGEVSVDLDAGTISYDGDATTEEMNVALEGTPYKVTEILEK